LKPSNVLLSGASGMIGSALCNFLVNQSIAVVRLVRDEANPEYGQMHWDPMQPTLPEIPSAFLPLDAAIHLSGANVAGHRWSKAYRRELIDSRVRSTEGLCRLFSQIKRPPEVLVCASAIGIYGDRGNEVLTEESTTGDGFLADLCREWEAASKAAEELGIRVVHLRFGVVLGRDGGVLAKLVPVFKAGVGGELGSGRQWMSWVALPDVVTAILFAIKRPELKGAFNVVSPNPVSNSEFTRSMGHVLRRPAVLPVPAFALKLIFGQMAEETMLASNRVLPARLSAAGFRFEYDEIEPALRSMLRG
jgi:uncharacterized protein